jgi:UDP-N-acetylglucosamine 2-epimerase (non-hydrolysing)
VSERTWTVAAGITLAVVVALLAQRVVPRMNVAGKPDRGQWVLQDFRDAVYYPVHLNPRVQAPVRRILDRHPRIHLLPPVSYGALVDLLRHCHLVLTDSGGIQEEAPSLGKPVLVLRDTTERREGIAAGTEKLVGTSRRGIVEETERLLHDPAAYEAMARAHNPYGDGRASERIVRVLRGALVAEDAA